MFDKQIPLPKMGAECHSPSEHTPKKTRSILWAGCRFLDCFRREKIPSLVTSIAPLHKTDLDILGHTRREKQIVTSSQLHFSQNSLNFGWDSILYQVLQGLSIICTDSPDKP